MNRLFLTVAFTVSLLPAPAPAVDLRNIRPRYGELGATRYDAKYLPGDTIFMTYDIAGLAIDPKTGKVSYETILELLDDRDKVLFKKLSLNEEVPRLGGTSMPGDLHVILGDKQAPGKYQIQLTIQDKLGKNAKAFRYTVDVISPTFGIIGVSAPATGFPGHDHVVNFDLVNFSIDPATNKPYIGLTIRILDEGGKVVAPPREILFPRDESLDGNLAKADILPLTYPVFANRSGRFTMEIVATDKVGNKNAELRFPFRILDLKDFTEPPNNETLSFPAPTSSPPVQTAASPPPTQERMCETRLYPKRFRILRGFRCR